MLLLSVIEEERIVNKERMDLIEKIDEYEKECLKSFELNKTEFDETFNETIKDCKLFYEKAKIIGKWKKHIPNNRNNKRIHDNKRKLSKSSWNKVDTNNICTKKHRNILPKQKWGRFNISVSEK